MNDARARVDYSKETGAVAQCAECPFWFAMRFTRREAWEAVRAHEKRAHPGSSQAIMAIASLDRYERNRPLQ